MLSQLLCVIYMFKTTAPAPSKAPMATAPVWYAAPPVLVVVVVVVRPAESVVVTVAVDRTLAAEVILDEAELSAPLTRLEAEAEREERLYTELGLGTLIERTRYIQRRHRRLNAAVGSSQGCN